MTGTESGAAAVETRKAYAYVVRETDEPELLVFRERDAEAGVQVPKGTVEDDETPHEAVVREAREETGLDEFDAVSWLASDRWPHPDKAKHYLRHFFRLDVSEAPKRWSHTVTGGDDDHGEVYELFWVPLASDVELARDMCDYVDRL